ncbi:MAG: hypothetical protein K6F81_05960 [Acholeplasmatales bacterium]|nr:hypothetical protein [Acholeplasmatales bacterium]
MKKYDRKIFLTTQLNEEIKNRLAHIDNGISGDTLIPDGVSFDVKYNREIVKAISRFIDFLKTFEPDEINKYFDEREEIIDLSNIYKGLKAYYPKDSYFKIIFLEEKALLRENEYTFLLLLKGNSEEYKNINVKELLSNRIEWKKEYIPTDTQKRIANYKGNNVVLGAAGTGKTDVAIHSYINSLPLDKIKSGTIRDDIFIIF